MHIDNLYFEVTRRCNMKCGHCLRGCAQKVDLTIDIVDRFLRLNEVTSIGRIGFSGGEPSLKCADCGYVYGTSDKDGVVAPEVLTTLNNRKGE